MQQYIEQMLQVRSGKEDLFFFVSLIVLQIKWAETWENLLLSKKKKKKKKKKTLLFKYIDNFTFKNWKFSDTKTLIFFIFLLKNINRWYPLESPRPFLLKTYCGYSLEPPRRGDSNEYPQYMFLSRNKKIVHTPVNPFYYIKVGFKWVKIYSHAYVMTKTQISQRIHAVWSMSGFGMKKLFKIVQKAPIEDTDQTTWMHRLILIVTGRKFPKVRFVTLRLKR